MATSGQKNMNKYIFGSHLHRIRFLELGLDVKNDILHTTNVLVRYIFHGEDCAIYMSFYMVLITKDKCIRKILSLY